MSTILFLMLAGPALALAQTASRPAEPARDPAQVVIDLERRMWQAWRMKDWETVLVSYRGTIMEDYEGRDVSGPYMYTTVWVKRGERWLMLLEQELRTTPVRIGRKHEKQ